MKKGLDHVLAVAVLILSAAQLVGCGCGQAQTDASEESMSDVQDIEREETKQTEALQTEKNADKKLSAQVQSLVDSLLATSELEAFTIKTNADINLEGNFISGEFLIDSTVAVWDDKAKDKLTMKLETTSNQDDMVSYAYYQDGWYYTDDKEGRRRTEKTSDEVLAGVTDITNMVIEAAGSITDMQVTKDGGDTVYTYSIPNDKAEEYFSQVTDKLGETNVQIAGASAQVAEITLTSIVGEDGLVKSQKVYILGKMKKAIFLIPSEVLVTADFYEGDETTFDFPENYDDWND